MRNRVFFLVTHFEANIERRYGYISHPGFINIHFQVVMASCTYTFNSGKNSLNAS